MRSTKIKILRLFFTLTICITFLSCEDKIDVVPEVGTTTGGQSINLTPTPVQTEFESIDDFLTSLKPAPQIFTFDPTVDNEIIGEDGTVFRFPANSILDANNNPYTGTVELNLTELMNPLSVLLNDRPTTAGGVALISAGAFELSLATPSGAPLTSTGYTSSVECETSDSMNVYRGEVKGDGAFDWVLVEDCDISYEAPEQSYVVDLATIDLYNIDIPWPQPVLIIRCHLRDDSLAYTYNIGELKAFINFSDRLSLVNFTEENDSTFVSPYIPLSEKGSIKCFGLGTDKGFVYQEKAFTSTSDTLVYNMQLEPITEDSLTMKLYELDD